MYIHDPAALRYIPQRWGMSVPDNETCCRHYNAERMLDRVIEALEMADMG
jgi:hypothetical protein